MYFSFPSSLSIVRYNVTGIVDFSNEMEEKKLGKPKISLQFQLSESGITELIKAEAAFEETYIVEEEVEVDSEDGDEKEGNGSVAEGGKTEERKLEEDAGVDNATESKFNVSDENSTTTSEHSEEKAKKKKTILQQQVSSVFFT